MVSRSQLLLVLIAASILDVPHKVFLITNVLFPNTSNRIAVIYGNYKCINCAKKTENTYLANVPYDYFTLKRKSHKAKYGKDRAEHCERREG